MKGFMRKRGKESWELRVETGRDPITGKRRCSYVSFRGGKREAQTKLAELVNAVSKGTHVESSKVTVAQHVRDRVTQWEASDVISARTAQRYRQLIENQIVPHLGNKRLQKLKPLDIEDWHAALRKSGRQRGKGGIAPRTIRHAHRVLSKSLADAVRNGVTARNVASIASAPKVDADEIRIPVADEIGTLTSKLEGNPIYPLAVTALFTGLRLGEALALRWRHTDIDGARVIQVREALEETKAHGLRTKPPKTKAGRRDIRLPDIVVDTLREHRRRQLELRMALGLGKPADDALVFPDEDGNLRVPSAVSRQWGIVAASVGLPHVTFHALRHAHASQLIDAGVDVVTIARRLGHANPTITLGVYAHLFRKDDTKAAAAINATLAAHTKA